jgi:hypothetical protein
MVPVCSALEFGEELSFCAVWAIWALAGINGVAICGSALRAKAESSKALAGSNLSAAKRRRDQARTSGDLLRTTAVFQKFGAPISRPACPYLRLPRKADSFRARESRSWRESPS